MTDDREILKYLLSHPQEAADEAWVRSMELKYPYFPLPALLKMRADAAAAGKEVDSAEIERLMLLHSGGEGTASSLLDPDMEDENTFYPPEETPAKPTTDSTIDTFLATYGKPDPTETATLERLIFNPVADYSQTLARRTASQLPSSAPTGNAHDDMINRFILSRSAEAAPPGDDLSPAPAPEETAPRAKAPRKSVQERQRKASAAPADNSLLSESLAKIFIKSRRYERAYEILANLSLAFPEKSAYFADQMRFLRKLMLNEQYRRRRQQENNES